MTISEPSAEPKQESFGCKYKEKINFNLTGPNANRYGTIIILAGFVLIGFLAYTWASTARSFAPAVPKIDVSHLADYLPFHKGS